MKNVSIYQYRSTVVSSDSGVNIIITTHDFLSDDVGRSGHPLTIEYASVTQQGYPQQYNWQPVHHRQPRTKRIPVHDHCRPKATEPKRSVRCQLQNMVVSHGMLAGRPHEFGATKNEKTTRAPSRPGRFHPGGAAVVCHGRSAQVSEQDGTRQENIKVPPESFVVLSPVYKADYCRAVHNECHPRRGAVGRCQCNIQGRDRKRTIVRMLQPDPVRAQCCTRFHEPHFRSVKMRKQPRCDNSLTRLGARVQGKYYLVLYDRVIRS